MGCQTVWPIKIKKYNAFVPYHGRLVFRVFLYALGVFSPKMKLFH